MLKLRPLFIKRHEYELKSNHRIEKDIRDDYIRQLTNTEYINNFYKSTRK